MSREEEEGCPVCAVMKRFHVPQAASDLFHRYVEAVAASCDVLVDADEEGFDFTAEPFDSAMDFMFENDEVDKSKFN